MWYLITETPYMHCHVYERLPLVSVVYGDDVYNYYPYKDCDELIVFSLQSHGVKRREQEIEKLLLAQKSERKSSY